MKTARTPTMNVPQPDPGSQTDRDDELASLKHWRETLERVGEHLWSWQLGTDRVEVSAGWLAAFGYAPAEVATGAAWYAKVHPDDVPRLNAAVAACGAAGNRVMDEEFRYRTRDGAYRWVRSRASVTAFDGNGAPLAMAGVYADVTDRHETEAALALAERRWKFALEGAGSGVWDWNLKSGDVYFSPQWKHMLGFDTEELEPTIETWRELAFPDDLARSDEAIRRYLAGEIGEYRCECRIRLKSGGTKWILDRGMIVERGADGQATRMIGTHEDITELKLREAELLESRERLNRIASLVPGMIYQVRRSTDGIVRFSWVSPSAEHILGLDAGSILEDGSRVFDAIHADDRARVQQTIVASAEHLSQWNEEFRVLIDGRVHWLHGIADPAAISPDDELGPGVLWHGHIANIDARMHAAQALNTRSKRLAALNQDLEQFNYIVSHDLKEPLRGIRHLSEWIAEDLGDDLPADVANNVERLHQRVARLQRLIEDLNQYARAARSDDSVSEIEVRRLVADLTADLDTGSARVDIRDVEDVRLETSDIALQTVLRNLINNALIHHDTPESAQVQVTASRVSDGVLFAVSDDGPGIPGKFHQRIFRIYQRLNPETGRDSSGTGLAIVKRILTQVGSSISVKSPLTDRGTRFEFLWPEQWPIEEVELDDF